MKKRNTVLTIKGMDFALALGCAELLLCVCGHNLMKKAFDTITDSESLSSSMPVISNVKVEGEFVCECKQIFGDIWRVSISLLSLLKSLSRRLGVSVLNFRMRPEAYVHLLVK